MYHQLLWRSVAQVLGHMHSMQSSYNPVTSILWTSNFESIQFMNHALSRPTMSIAVTECSASPGKSMMRDRSNGSWKWKSPGSNHPRTTLTKLPTVATQLSLALQWVLCFHSQ